jgi:hypothetical protein
MYGELVESFQGLKIREFNAAGDWKGPAIAYRLREEYDDEVKIADRLDSLLKQPDVEELTALVVGAWTGACEGANSREMVELLVRAAPRLSGLKHLFFGEMTYEECEVSWINQSDLSPILCAYPDLESLRVRGGTGLSFSTVRHDHLRELAVETGGLPRSTIREICLCDFPALEHLELLLGESNYGFDGSVEDLQPLLSGRLFPRLKWLGLMNSEIANEIAAVVVNAPLVTRLEHLDLSLGNMDGEGFRSLSGLAAATNLRSLNLSHHYASEEDVVGLTKSLICQVTAEDERESEDEWRPIVHAE